MTTILLITNKNDITTDFIVNELTRQDASFYRLNTEEIGNSVEINFDFENGTYDLIDKTLKKRINLSNIISVYFRRPEIKSNFQDVSPSEKNFLQREILASLETLYILLSNANWLNSLDAIRKAENKSYQLLKAKQIGLTIPPSIISSNSDSALKFYEKCKKDCIIKPIRNGLIQDDDVETIIFTSKISLNRNNIDRIKSCPVYIQKHIKKSADVRVTVVGDSVFAAKIHSQEDKESQVDWRRSENLLNHTILELPKKTQNMCIDYVQSLNLTFGAIDFILTEKSEYIFLEINPNGQWAWIERRLGLPIAKTITKLLLEKQNFKN